MIVKRQRFTGDLTITYPDRVIVHEDIVMTASKYMEWGVAALAMAKEFKGDLNTAGEYSATITKEE